ncbi:hypothetical protein [Bradyrhizobium cenepequi]
MRKAGFTAGLFYFLALEHDYSSQTVKLSLSVTLAIDDDSMRILAACCLALGPTALASDVQLGDHVMTISDGIGCSDLDVF